MCIRDSPLLFLIGLSVVLILGALLISRSDLPENDKIFAIICILGLFCVVAIINEAKRGTSPEDLKFNPIDFEKHFFSLREQENANAFKLPILKDSPEYLSTILGGIKLDGVNQVFLLLEGDARSGKSFALREYTLQQQSNGIPVMYIDLHQPTSLNELSNLLKPQNVHSLEDTIERFNQRGKYPTIIVDGIEKGFSSENKLVPHYCSICEVLRDLYDSKKISVVFTTNQQDVKEKFLLHTSFLRRLIIKEFSPRSQERFSDYVKNEINPLIPDPAKKFKDEQIIAFYTHLGPSFQYLDEYIKGLAGFKDVNGFIDKALEELKAKLLSHRELDGIYNVLLENMRTSGRPDVYTNQLVPFSNLKRSGIPYLADKLEDGIRYDFLSTWQGFYKFKNNAVLSAAALALKNQGNSGGQLVNKDEVQVSFEISCSHFVWKILHQQQQRRSPTYQQNIIIII
eukprot:TRINITY_DN5338_c0_g2_i1.p1 TRINITY_DN5338_c0_g2~~TRINITY_DN5338_c0_g2_i1.p1  ORF type:complete len:456 (+),score=88.19 TRINITY_DN5338_c0_g2_i1:65-1432(+)